MQKFYKNFFLFVDPSLQIVGLMKCWHNVGKYLIYKSFLKVGKKSNNVKEFI